MHRNPCTKKLVVTKLPGILGFGCKQKPAPQPLQGKLTGTGAQWAAVPGNYYYYAFDCRSGGERLPWAQARGLRPSRPYLGRGIALPSGSRPPPFRSQRRSFEPSGSQVGRLRMLFRLQALALDNSCTRNVLSQTSLRAPFSA